MDIDVVWRLFNIGLVILTGGMIAKHARERWEGWDADTRLMVYAVGLFLLAVLVTTVENLRRHAAPAAGAATNTITVGFCLIAFWVIHRYREGDR